MVREMTFARGNFFMAMNFLEFEQPIAELEAKIEELKFIAAMPASISPKRSSACNRRAERSPPVFRQPHAWQITELARHPQRPYTLTMSR